MVVLEANLDDATGEQLAHAVRSLLDAGAHDAWVTPVVMKKGRPGPHRSTCWRTRRCSRRCARCSGSTTGTFGVRALHGGAVAGAPAPSNEVRVEGHPVRVKVGGGRIKPEFDDVARASSETGLARPRGGVAGRRGLADAGARRGDPPPTPPDYPEDARARLTGVAGGREVAHQERRRVREGLGRTARRGVRGSACSRLSVEPEGVEEREDVARSNSSSSHCDEEQDRAADRRRVAREPLAGRARQAHRPRTATPIRGSAATSGSPMIVPIDSPHHPTGGRPAPRGRAARRGSCRQSATISSVMAGSDDHAWENSQERERESSPRSGRRAPCTGPSIAAAAMPIRTSVFARLST